MKEEKKLKPDFFASDLNGIGEKTFLGWGKLSTRSLLFFLFGAFAMISSAGGLYIADKRLSNADGLLESAKALDELVISIEDKIWRIRVNEKSFLLFKNAKYIDALKLNMSQLSDLLIRLYDQASAAPVKEHITTINEGLAQYATEFESAVAAQGTQVKTEDLSKTLLEPRREIEARVISFQIDALTNSLAAIKESEKVFVDSGAMKDLVKLNKDIDAFAAGLAASKLKEEIKTLIENLLKTYRENLAPLAKSKLMRQRDVNRLEEISDYITPSVNGISSFAKSNVVKANNDAQLLRQLYRTILPAGGAAILISIMLFGLVMLRSIADPVRNISQAAKKLAAGEENIVIPALGNKDEMGDAARALFMLKNKFFVLSRSSNKENDAAGGETARLRLELDAAKEKAKKGDAAMAEATKLRLELETLKPQLEKGAILTNEAERLRLELSEARKEIFNGEAAMTEAAKLRLQVAAMKSEADSAANLVNEADRLRYELEETKKKIFNGEKAMAEEEKLRLQVAAMKSEMESASLSANEAERLRLELEETKKEVAKGEASLIEAALLRIDLDATKKELEKATAKLLSAMQERDAEANSLVLRHPQSSEPALQTALPGQITKASQQLAKYSQNVSAAAYEAERTGVMIKGLIAAAAKIDAVDALLASIVSQTDFILPQPRSSEAYPGMADSSMMVVTSDYKKAMAQAHAGGKDEAIGQRFDAIRTATNQAAWNIKDIAGIIMEVKEVAAEIASASSAEALKITNDLLEQSEHLRGMLDSLVVKIQGSSQG